ncbi:MAG: hypothetical protein E7I51_26495 [Raoultella sp.]|nr:hypothetical protein [Raoultella sp.]
MSTITKEQAKDLRNAFQCWQQDYDPAEDKEQYDMFGLGMVAMDALLASLEAEAVGYIDAEYAEFLRSGHIESCSVYAEAGEGCTAVFSAPLAPASIHDEDLLHMAASAIEDLLSNKDRTGAGVWADIPGKLRRAAMLQGAENAESPTTMQTAPALDYSPKISESPSGNSPGIPDGLRLALSNAGIAAPESDEMLAATSEKYIQELVTWVKDRKPFRSAVIPDGWVAVPVEPTEDMIVNGFESEPDESFSDEREWEAYDALSGCQQAAHRAKLCWAAMIAAAQKAL